MKQFSPKLFIAQGIFKKQFLKVSLLLFFVAHIGIKTNAQCAVNPVANQAVCNNTATTPINFTGTATTFNWVNNTPSIGLAASGTGNIAAFTALNTTATAVTATITVTPSSGACTGTPVSFTITVNPTPVIIITPSTSCGGVPGLYGGPLIASSGTSPIPGSVSVSSGTVNLTVPDNTANGISSPVTMLGVPANATITNVSVTLNMSHTYPGDMIFNLKAPNGQVLNLYKYGTGLLTGPASGPATWGWYGAKVSQTGIQVFSTIAVAPYIYNNSIAWKADLINTPIGGVTIQNPAGFVSNATSWNQLYSVANGGWTLAMADGGHTGDIGILASWTLTIDYTTPGGGPILNYLWGPFAGLYSDPQTTTPYNGANTPNVYAAPTAFTIFTVTGTNAATGCSGTASTMVNNTPPGAVITPASATMCLGDPAVKLKVNSSVIPVTAATWSPISGLFTDASALPAFAYTGIPIDSIWVKHIAAGPYMYQVVNQGMPAPALSFTNAAAITIPVGGTATAYPANLNVSGVPSNATIRSIVLNGVNHSRSADIDIILQSPTGQNVILMSDVGGSNAVNATYTLTDAAVAAMSATTANPTGTYKPTNAIGAIEPDNFPAPGPGAVSQPNPTTGFFTGAFNGTWKLFVVDDDGTADQGVISGGFTINFDIGLQGCISPVRNVVVNVVNPVTITTQPANQALCPGSIVASFTVSVAGAGPAGFQWQVSYNGGIAWNNIFNGGAYSGSNTATLTIVPVTAGMNGYLYRLLINGGTGCSVTSNTALLTINPLPTAVISASLLIIGPLQTSTISSTVTANPAATYAWYLNGSVLPGEVSPTLLVNYGSPGDYQLKVTNACGTGLSNIVTIANSFALNMFTYPNPSGGIFQVRYTSPVNTTVQRSLIIYNNQGNKIISKNFTQTIPYQKVDVDVRAHGKGIYWVELKDGYGRRLAMSRVVVQ